MYIVGRFQYEYIKAYAVLSIITINFRLKQTLKRSTPGFWETKLGGRRRVTATWTRSTCWPSSTSACSSTPWRTSRSTSYPTLTRTILSRPWRKYNLNVPICCLWIKPATECFYRLSKIVKPRQGSSKERLGMWKLKALIKLKPLPRAYTKFGCHPPPVLKRIFFLTNPNLIRNPEIFRIQIRILFVVGKFLYLKIRDLGKKFWIWIQIWRNTGCPISLGPLCFCYFLGF